VLRCRERETGAPWEGVLLRSREKSWAQGGKAEQQIGSPDGEPARRESWAPWLLAGAGARPATGGLGHLEVGGRMKGEPAGKMEARGKSSVVWQNRPNYSSLSA
jgi:hypothetical protein